MAGKLDCGSSGSLENVGARGAMERHVVSVPIDSTLSPLRSCVVQPSSESVPPPKTYLNCEDKGKISCVL